MCARAAGLQPGYRYVHNAGYGCIRVPRDIHLSTTEFSPRTFKPEPRTIFAPCYPALLTYHSLCTNKVRQGPSGLMRLGNCD